MDAGNWIAIGAMLVALAGLILSIITMAQNNKLRKTAQARAVTCWRAEPGEISAYDQGALGITILNFSEGPITNVYVPHRTISHDERNAGEEIETATILGTMMAGEKQTQTYPPVKQPRPLRVQFTDASGQRWERDTDGKLTKLKRQ